MLSPHPTHRFWSKAPVLLTLAALAGLILCAGAATAAESPAPALSVEQLLAVGRAEEALSRAREEIAAMGREPGDGPRRAAARAASLGVQFFMAPVAEAWDGSEELLRDAAARWEKIGPEAGAQLAETLSNLSSMLFYQDRWEEAAGPEERALALRVERFGAASPEAASSLQGLGLIDTRRARFASAETRLNEALSIRERVFKEAADGEPRSRAAAKLMETLGALGDLLRVEDRLEEAESFCRRAVEVARMAQLEETIDAAAALNNLAGVLKDQSRFDEAAPLLTESLEVRQKEGAGSADVATAQLNLAELRRLQGREEDAVALYDDALAAARDSLGADHPELFWFLNQKATLLRQMGRPDKAEPLVTESLDLLERTLDPGDPMRAIAMQEMADLRCDQARYEEAAALYEKARALRAEAWGAQHPDAAVTLAARAACAARSPASQPADVLDMSRRALEPLRATSLYPDQEASMLALQASQLWKLGRRDEAIVSQREAVDLLESLRPRAGGSEWTRAGFFRRFADEFDRLAIWLLDLGRPADALAAAERGRARSLLDQLTAAHVDLLAAMPSAQRQELTQRERQAALQLAEAQEKVRIARADLETKTEAQRPVIAALEKDAQRAAAAYREAYEAIRDASQIWRRIQGIEPVSLAIAQKSLVPRRGLILYYLVAQDRSMLLAIPPEPAAPIWREITGRPRAAQLELPAGPIGTASMAGAMSDLVRDLSAAPAPAGLSEASDDATEALLQGLSEAFQALVPEEIWSRARTAQEVILVPDGALHALPFEALVVRPFVAGKPPRYWLDEGPAIRYTASLSLLEHLAGLAVPAGHPDPNRSTADLFLLTVGDPRPAGTEALPGSGTESVQVAAAVTRAMPSATIKALTGPRASEPEVRAEMPRARFIHMATHAVVDRRRSDLLASLELAPAGPGPAVAGPGPATAGPVLPETDGSLQLFEIYGLHLRCDLAVLSACATQYGRQMEGEGAMALARGFLAAGSRRVVASLWPVEDLSTAHLISTMFERIARDAARARAVPYARALAEARRAVRKDPRWSAPFYWAPFILTGAS